MRRDPQEAERLRDSGRTYQQIDDALRWPHGTAWRVINRERNSQNVNESVARYIARGRVALADMEA